MLFKKLEVSMTEQEFYTALGQKIKNLRKTARMTQEEVAVKAGIYRQDLSAFEKRGDKIKSANQIRLIVEATGHTMEDLFIDAGKKKLNLKLMSRASASRPSAA